MERKSIKAFILFCFFFFFLGKYVKIILIKNSFALSCASCRKREKKKIMMLMKDELITLPTSRGRTEGKEIQLFSAVHAFLSWPEHIMTFWFLARVVWMENHLYVYGMSRLGSGCLCCLLCANGLSSFSPLSSVSREERKKCFYSAFPILGKLF